jgi:hypothetical protein
LQVTDFLQQRKAPTVGERQSLQSLDDALKPIGDAAAPVCRTFIAQMIFFAYMGLRTRGRAGASVATVRVIWMHFAQHGLSHLWAQQQRQIRAASGDDLKIDNTYKSGTSLCGAVTEVSASGRAKTA